MITVHRLEGFYWVARTGGYASAARAFPYPITQPAVHQQVKKLEAELGLALFERAGRDRLLLTAAGKRLFEFIEPFYRDLPGTLRSLSADDLAGELRIGAPALYLRYLLPAWIKRLRVEHPRLQVFIRETRWSDLDALAKGELDLLVDYLPDVPDAFAAMRVATSRPFLVCPEDHPLAQGSRLTPKALAREPFVAYHPGHLRDLQEEALNLHGLEPEARLVASTAEAILGLVAAGLGYTILGWVGQDGPRAEGTRVFPIRRPAVEFPVWAVWRKDTPENPMLDAALETAPRE